MEHILNNPIYSALITGNSHLSLGNGPARYFPKEISPFAGVQELDEMSFTQLADMLPPKRIVAIITAKEPAIPSLWKILHQSVILQMIGEAVKQPTGIAEEIVSLKTADIPQMLALTKLTNPGPFLERTIEFGNYKGVFDGEKLIAMAGHRLHAGQYIEISAVCTHPDYLGKGYAGELMLNQAKGIMEDGKTPFLHVRADNERAINLYKKLGFAIRSNMHFNLLQK